ncbi:uncharacterized protein LOC119409626 [Nematolebias whitei]|uniref:uncharacterized protein LOC119409626 n=1 Tax=Nematolebias whitei TaxID=451745 RepID=UPI00189A0C27|nr:uncharacterized protein LOC119409626 [Nematolebias whitei]
MFPPLSQILKSLCCSSSHQQEVQSCLTAAVGTVQIMVGLFNIGLGPGRTSTRPGDFSSLGAAYWLGAVFIVTGIMSILAGQFPSSCLMGFTVFMNIVGAIFSITAIALYVVDLGDADLLWICARLPYDAAPHDDSCRNVALFDQNLLTSMDKTLITLALLLLVVSVRFAVLGIRFLVGEMKKDAWSSIMMLTSTLQIMVGLFNIGLGPGRTSMHPGDVTNLGAAYWLGAVVLLPVGHAPEPSKGGPILLSHLTHVFGLLLLMRSSGSTLDSSGGWSSSKTEPGHLQSNKDN